MDELRPHGTGTTNMSGITAEDVKIMVRTFLAEKGVEGNSKAGTTPCRANTYNAWQSPMRCQNNTDSSVHGRRKVFFTVVCLFV